MKHSLGWALVPLALWGVLAVGCTPPPPPDTDASGMDAFTQGDTASESSLLPETSRTDGGTSEASVCDLGMAPTTLPMVTSEFLILGTGDAGSMFPTGSGGDANFGSMVISSARVYLPARADGLIIPNESSLRGTGWVSADGMNFRLFLDMELRIATTERVGVGTVLRPVLTRVRGTYTTQNGRLLIVPAAGCAPSMEMGMAMLSFSRDAPDRARLYLLLSGPTGESLLELALTRPG